VLYKVLFHTSVLAFVAEVPERDGDVEAIEIKIILTSLFPNGCFTLPHNFATTKITNK
jgi:hypothetical protein